MEGILKYEKPEINFLNKNLWVTYRIDPEALANFPEITGEQFETKQEKFGILLGYSSIVNGKMVISIKAFLQMEDSNNEFYKEGICEVADVKIEAIRKMVRDVKSAHPEFDELHLVGELHTHPVMSHELENEALPWEPSRPDIEAIAMQYANGVLRQNEPYIFGVAGLNNDGETVYEFYKINKTDGIFSYEKINLVD